MAESVKTAKLQSVEVYSFTKEKKNWRLESICDLTSVNYKKWPQ